MFIEEIDKFKDLMGINDLIGCVYNFVNENWFNRGYEINNESV